MEYWNFGIMEEWGKSLPQYVGSMVHFGVLVGDVADFVEPHCGLAVARRAIIAAGGQ